MFAYRRPLPKLSPQGLLRSLYMRTWSSFPETKRYNLCAGDLRQKSYCKDLVLLYVCYCIQSYCKDCGGSFICLHILGGLGATTCVHHCFIQSYWKNCGGDMSKFLHTDQNIYIYIYHMNGLWGVFHIQTSSHKGCLKRLWMVF